MVHLPLLYPGSASAGEDALRLGRETRWSDAGTPPVRGLGQRVLLAGEEAPALADIASLRLSGPAGPGSA